MINKQNPYSDSKELSALGWMKKYHGKKMLFSFIFISIFMVAPWLTELETNLSIWITIAMTLLNFVSTILHPYLIYKRNTELYDNWERRYNK